MLGMEADPRYWNADKSDLVYICNGYGPDAWSDKLREIITWIFENFPESADIHDFDFKFSNGDPKTLAIINKRFSDNNSKKLSHLYPMSRPWLYHRRAIAWFKIHTAYRMLQLESESSWKSAYERYSKEDCRYCVSRTPSTNMCHLRNKDTSTIGWCRAFTAIDVSAQS
jgi:hypothetical protein